jgi:hypothetical protein
MVKSRIIRSVMAVSHMRETKNAFKILVGN